MLWLRVLLYVFLVIGLLMFAIYSIAPKVWGFLARDLDATFIPGDYDPQADPILGKPQECIPRVKVTPKGSYEIHFGEGRLLRYGNVMVQVNGKTYTANFEALPATIKGDLGELQLVGQKEEASSGPMGDGIESQFEWTIPMLNLRIITSIVTFPNKPYLLFRTEFPGGLPACSTGRRNFPVFRFPFLQLMGPTRRIFGYKVQVFSPPIKRLQNSSTQGPVVWYDNDLNALVLGPTDHFVLGYTGQDFDRTEEPCSSDSEVDNSRWLYHGLEGQLQEIPPGYVHENFLLFTQGINNAVVEWCQHLQKIHQVSPRDPLSDPVVGQLGYWTDNGAYYYYRTEKGMTYADTLLYAKNLFDIAGLPIRYFQLDSWWYRKVPKKSWTRAPKKWFAPLVKGLAKGGTDKWDVIPEYFPHGLKVFREKLGLPLAAHARWFAPESAYTSQYEFQINEFGAHPLEKRFWEDLMAWAEECGITLYEQDWITTMFNNIPLLTRDIRAGENFLMWMGDAAHNHGLTIQYCMAPPGVFLYGLKLPAVTNARTGGDYWARAPKEFFIHDITQANILCWGIGIWPSYDVFYSKRTSIFTEQFFYRERYPELMALLSTLGGGLVCPGDRATRVNVPLLLQTCDADGVLIKPDRPITPNDCMFRVHSKPYIMDTWSQRGELFWRYIVSVPFHPKRISDPGFSLSDLGYSGRGVMYDYISKDIFEVDSTTRVSLPKKRMKTRYLVFAPFFREGLAFVGTPTKFTTCAGQLFPSIEWDGRELNLVVTSAPKTELPLLFYCRLSIKRIEIGDRELADSEYIYDPRTGNLLIPFQMGAKGSCKIKLTFLPSQKS